MMDEKTNKKKKTIKERWQDFKESLKTPEGKKKLLIFIVIFVVVLVTGFTVYNRYFAKEKPSSTANNSGTLPSINESTAPSEKKVISIFDGQSYPENVANRHALAIMVENQVDSRPQSGLDKAKIVYEAITEGGITRFMAIYGPESTSKVGPVRSARTYYLDWDLEYDGFYAHVGGNLDALQLIPELKIKDLDQFRYGEQAYSRIPRGNRATEHTMYTDTDKLWKIAEDNGWDMKANFDSYEFKDDALLDQRPNSQSIGINFSTASYKVTWDYDKTNNVYLRSMAGSPHKDEVTGEQLKAKIVIIQEVQRWETTTSINEAGWAMKTVGEGNAKIVMDGKVIEGKWKKENRTSRTVFTDADGNKIKYDPGTMWVEIIPPSTPVTIS
jgi:hypothetical protein